MRFSARSVVTSLAFSSVAVAQLSSLPVSSLPITVPSLPSLPLPIDGLDKLVQNINTLLTDLSKLNVAAIPGDVTTVVLDVIVLGLGAGHIGTASSLPTSQATQLVSAIVSTVCPQLVALKSTATSSLPLSSVTNGLYTITGTANIFLKVLGNLPAGIDTSAATACLNSALAAKKRSGGATIPVELAGF